MTSVQPFRLGLVGCGGISGRHARAAATAPGVAIVACCDIRADVAEAWSRRHGCERAYGELTTMLREHDLDGAVIATWPNLHREHVLACLEAGVRNVLCEKALTPTGAEALEVWDAARAADALVVEAFMYRHQPAIAQMDDLLAAGEVGAVDHIRASFNLFDPCGAAPDDPTRDWRQRADLSGGVPHDLACYCVDACNRFAAARPRRALAVAGASELYGTVDRLFGLLEYENGRVGIVASTSRSDFNHELVIAGRRGELRLPVAWRIDTPTELVLTRSTGWGEFDVRRFPVAAADPFRLQLEAFVAAARGERPPAPALAESVVTAFTIDALLASAAEHEAVEIELPTAVLA